MDDEFDYDDVKDQPVDVEGIEMKSNAKNNRFYIVNDNDRNASFTTLAGKKVLPGEVVALDEDESAKWINSGLASYVADECDE